METTLSLKDSEEGKYFQALIFSDLLVSEEPVMASSRMNELALQIAGDYPEITNKKKLREAVKSNTYYQALQVKYAYAITCHKAQGGQWKNVFVDLGYFMEDMLNEEFYRWLYTAFTRASASLYLVNFKDEFFHDEE